eukprot:13472128-Heterocapsa_arctica.AAC.1
MKRAIPFPRVRHPPGFATAPVTAAPSVPFVPSAGAKLRAASQVQAQANPVRKVQPAKIHIVADY